MELHSLNTVEPVSHINRVEEAVTYIREHEILCRLMDGFREKYLSYGRFGGSVLLKRLKPDDIEVLEGFFQTSFHGKKQVTISAVKFQKALAASRFSLSTPEEILQEYFGESLQGKRQQAEERQHRMDELMDLAEKCWQEPVISSWIRDLRQDQKNGIHYYLRQKLPFDCLDRYMKSDLEASPDSLGVSVPSRSASGHLPLLYQNFEKWNNYSTLTEKLPEEKKVIFVLILGASIVEGFPCYEETFEYLPVFAAKITGDPHFFDQGTPAGSFLYKTAQWMSRKEGRELPSFRGFSSLLRQRIYLNAGIIQGDSSNYAMLYGLRAYGKDGKAHSGMDGFLTEGDMVQIPLHVIGKWSALSCPDQRIWIVENPSVYSVLCQQSHGRYACMCMNGQPNLSSLTILDLLAHSGISVYYAGDFDPEGLQIAQNLKQYYTGNFYYWHMAEEDYEISLSSVSLTSRRMKILRNITDPELLPVTEKMRLYNRAGYQENLWIRYLADPVDK